MATIKSVFEEAAVDFKVDEKLIQRLRDFERNFVNRSEHHIKFFGGQLTGVHPMRFTPNGDTPRWFSEVLDIDDLAIEEGIKPLIPAHWKRANDVFNHSCIWLTYRIFNSNLSPRLKEEGAKLTMQIMSYKLLGSILSRHFPYPADEGTAQATLAAMSRKFLIKTSKSWHDLLEKRAIEMISPRSVHRNAYMTMSSDDAVIRMVHDIQNRLKEIMKSISTVFHDIHSRGVKIRSERSVLEQVDGSVVLMDKTRQYTTFIRYLHEVMDDPNSFVRDDLVDVIADSLHTLNPKLLVEVLEWMSRNRLAPRHGYITELADETLIYAFELIASDRKLYNSRGGLPPLIAKLKAMYMASRMSNESLLKTKGLADKVVRAASKTKSESSIAAARTGIQMYLVLRGLAMQYYQSQNA